MLSLSSLAHAFSRYRREHRTRIELDRLSERELQDIGLTRADIPLLAREAARAGGLDLFTWHRHERGKPQPTDWEAGLGRPRVASLAGLRAA